MSRVIEETTQIRYLQSDISDVEACLERQVDESNSVRRILEFYCHQHAYVTHIMAECRDILVDGTRLPYGY